MAPSENQNSPLPPSPVSASGAGDLQEQLASLRKVYVALLISTLVLGSALGLFLLRQVFAMNRQIVEAKRFMADFQTNALPRINWFVGNLQTFAKTNADLNPILAKYNLLPTTSAAPAAVAAPKAPAPKAPAPKK